MVHAIAPLSSKELYSFVVQPYIEGSERLNRAWHGIDFHSLTHTKFSLKEKAVFLLSGICLVVFPLINSVIWLAWKTFGHPEILSDPYVSAAPPEVSTDAAIAAAEPSNAVAISIMQEKGPELALTEFSLAPAVESPQPVAAVQEDAPRIEQFSYSESSKNFQGKTDWKMEYLPNEIRAQIESPRERTHSRYNKNGELLEYHCTEKDEDLHVWLTEDRHLKISAHRGTRIEERDYKLEKKLVWLQQSTLGLKNFVLDPAQNECRYYCIRPDNIVLVEVVVRKKGEEVLPGRGKTIRVEMKMDHYFYRYLREGELWFDPSTGKMLKLVDSGRFMETTTTELI